jgi:fatty-acyl-CoA synthase
MMSSFNKGWTCADLFQAGYRRHPGRVAYAYDEGEFSGSQCTAREAQIARALAARGLRRGRGLTALSVGRPEAFMAASAALSLGCHYTPLPPLGSASDHAFILDDADISVVVFDPRQFEERAAALIEMLPDIEFLSLGPSAVAEDLMAIAEEYSSAPFVPLATESDVALLHYSGGTTGRPKGVILPHRAVASAALLMYAEYQWPDEVNFLACHPVTHSPLLAIRMLGGNFVMLPGFDPEAFVYAVKKYQINTTVLVPSMLYALLDYAKPDDLAGLQTVIYGAAPISPARLAQAVEVFGPIFMQWYSQTEAIHAVTMLRKEEHDLSRPERFASCGRPLYGVDVEIHDDDEQPVEPGELGELCVRGPVVMDGYWNLPELTDETLRDGWLHTGDVARADDEGYITLVDRSKDVIITHGSNVYPREIEDALTSHPDVSLAAVIGIPDDVAGEAVKAFVVPRSGTNVAAAELMTLVEERKGRLHVPTSVDVIDSLPLTANQKPDKKVLRQRFWAAMDRQIS